jgi:hypothetical protein
VLARRIERSEALLAPLHNLDALQSPAYYVLAGAWLRLGRALGLDGAPLLYCVRALAAPAAFALVFGAWVLLRAPYARSRFVRLGVPALLAFPPGCLHDERRACCCSAARIPAAWPRRTRPEPARHAPRGSWSGGTSGFLNALLVAVAGYWRWPRAGGSAVPRRAWTWLALFAALLLPSRPGSCATRCCSATRPAMRARSRRSAGAGARSANGSHTRCCARRAWLRSSRAS